MVLISSPVAVIQYNILKNNHKTNKQQQKHRQLNKQQNSRKSRIKDVTPATIIATANTQTYTQSQASYFLYHNFQRRRYLAMAQMTSIKKTYIPCFLGNKKINLLPTLWVFHNYHKSMGKGRPCFSNSVAKFLLPMASRIKSQQRDLNQQLLSLQTNTQPFSQSRHKLFLK